MEVYLVRHTIPQIEKGICYGQTDIPLAETFHADSEKVLKYLPEGIDIVYSSPLNRCMQLAGLIKSNQKVIQDVRLMEMNFGDWEMKKWEDINPPELNKWMLDFVNEKTPGGECFTALNQRVKTFFDERINSFNDEKKKIAIITHAGVIRSLLCTLLTIPLTNAFKISLDYGSTTKLNIDKNFSNISYINRTV